MYGFVLLIGSSLSFFLVSGSSLVRSQPGHTVRLVPYLPLIRDVYPSFVPPFLFSSLLFFCFLLQKGVGPKWLYPKWQHLETQKWLVAAMSICLACAGAAFALQPPVLSELCRLCCWLPAPQAAFCSFVSWHSTLHCRPRSLFSMLIHCFPLFSVPFAVWGKKKYWVASLGILSGSSSGVRFSSLKPYGPSSWSLTLPLSHLDSLP